MGKSHEFAGPKYILIIAAVLLLSTEVSYAQTVEEFLAKDRQEQRQIIDNIVPTEILRLTSKTIDGRQKTQEELKHDRRLANYIRASYTNYGVRKGTAGSNSEPEGIDKLRSVANLLKKKYANASVRDFFIERVNAAYRIVYTDSNGIWKTDFDSQTDSQQVALYRAELARIKRAADQAVVDHRKSELARLEAEKKAVQEQRKQYENELKEIEQESKETEDVLAVMRIQMLKLDFRRSKTDPKIVVLVFKNEKESPVTFDLRCSKENSVAKMRTISVPANGESEIAFIQANNYILGDRCEFSYKGEIVRTLPEK